MAHIFIHKRHVMRFGTWLKTCMLMIFRDCMNLVVTWLLFRWLVMIYRNIWLDFCPLLISLNLCWLVMILRRFLKSLTICSWCLSFIVTLKSMLLSNIKPWQIPSFLRWKSLLIVSPKFVHHLMIPREPLSPLLFFPLWFIWLW